MKIFGIGLSKTGTTSLANALRILGYRTVDNMGAERYASGDTGALDLDLIEHHDAFTDTPVPSLFKELDGLYPGSKFILTVRGEAAWLKSCRKQFNQRHAEQRSDAINAIFEELYGAAAFDEALFLAGYRRFVEGVKQYFAGRPNDLLVMDVAGGDGWELLCPFLDRALPEVPFPKANVTRLSWTHPEDLVGLAEQAGADTLEVFSALHGTELAVTGKTGPCAISGNLRWLLRKLRYRGARNAGRAVEEASCLSLRRIEAGLRRIDAAIPIVSPNTPPSLLQEQQDWNHFWLVNPLDGRDEFARSNGIYALSIALVQDRTPIMGVVHAPTLGSSYFGAAWRGTIKSVGGVLLAESTDGGRGSDALPMTRQEQTLVQELRSDPGSVRLSRSLRLCFSPLLPQTKRPGLDASAEWETAAAHVLLKALGVGVVSVASGNELVYNKNGFANGAIELH